MQNTQQIVYKIIKDNNETLFFEFFSQKQIYNSLTQDYRDCPLIIEAIKQQNKKIFLFLFKHPLYQKYQKINQVLDKDGVSVLGQCALNAFEFGLRIMLNDFSTLIEKKLIDRKEVKQLTHSIDVNQTLEDGSTIFHIAVLSNKPSILKIIIENGGDYNVIHEEGTPLHLAIKERCYKSAAYLAKIEDYDFSLVDNFGNTIIHECIFLDLEQVFKKIMLNLDLRLQSQEVENTIKILNIQNNIGNTLLFEAAQQKNQFYLEYFKQNIDKYGFDLNHKNLKGEVYTDMKQVYRKRKVLVKSNNNNALQQQNEYEFDSNDDDEDQDNSEEEQEKEEINDGSNKKDGSEEQEEEKQKLLKNNNNSNQQQGNHSSNKDIQQQQKSDSNDGSSNQKSQRKQFDADIIEQYQESYSKLKNKREQMEQEDSCKLIVYMVLFIIFWALTYFYFTNGRKPINQDLQHSFNQSNYNNTEGDL